MVPGLGGKPNAEAELVGPAELNDLFFQRTVEFQRLDWHCLWAWL